jgi:hypothetical protein
MLKYSLFLPREYLMHNIYNASSQCAVIQNTDPSTFSANAVVMGLGLMNSFFAALLFNKIASLGNGKNLNSKSTELLKSKHVGTEVVGHMSKMDALTDMHFSQREVFLIGDVEAIKASRLKTL